MQKGFRLTSAIIAISIGALEFVFGVMMIASNYLLLLGVITVVLTSAIIVLGSLMLPNYKSKGVAIALLAVNSVSLLIGFYLLMSGGRQLILSIVPHGTLLAFLIVTLVKWDDSDAKLDSIQKDEEIDKKITLLKNLKETGDISDEEYKQLLLDLLKNSLMHLSLFA